jgi:PIN domain nuclease of toxin-antitoxin system
VKLLLDSPIVLWALAEPAKLVAKARVRIADPANTVAVSAVTAWNISLRISAGTLRFNADLARALADVDFLPLPVTVDHIVAAAKLPPHHDDQFERVLVAQALSGGWTLVTRNGRLADYGVPLLAG